MPAVTRKHCKQPIENSQNGRQFGRAATLCAGYSGLRQLAGRWLAIGVTWIVCASPALAAPKAVSLQLDGDHQFRYAGYYAALWKGYYKSAGLDVEIRGNSPPGGAGNIDVISSVVNDEATFGVGGAELLLASDRGFPVVALAVILQRSGIELYANSGQLIESPFGLAEKKLGVADRPLHWITHELLWNRANRRLPGGQVIALSSTNPRHLSQVDAMFGDSLNFPYVANQLDINTVSFKPEHHGVDLPGSTIFTSRALLGNNPELVEKFVLASLEGWRYALQNSDEIAMQLTRKQLAPGTSQNTFGVNFYQIEKIRELTMYPVVPLGNNSAHRWAAAHEQLRAAGLVDNPFSSAQFIYDPVERLRKRAARSEWWTARGLPLLVVLTLMALCAYSYHWRLQRKAARKLFREANYDGLTGLPNRQHALRYLDTLDNASSPQSSHVLFIDLDGFKRVNDQFGHATGDVLLKMAAQRLTEVCQPCALLARLGGDEFVAVLHDASPREAKVMANRIVTQMKQPFHIDSRQIHIGASIGGAVSSRTDRVTAPDLLLQADTAMYQAKTSGKSRYRLFDQALYDKARENNDLEAQLHNALARRELSLCYQPIISLHNQQCVGAEALLRWHSRTLGNVTPDRFIPIAEANGLIDDIGAWVLNEAGAQLARWQSSYRSNFSIAVNVSPRQFFTQTLLRTLQQLEPTTGIKPQSIKLEITEGVFASPSADISQLLNSIQRMGYSFSIDDFGTGYASLNYLRRFPARTLKIDRSFISGLYTDPRNQALVKAIIGMAHSLNMQVVAEGVENGAQVDFLSHLNCEYAQGYLFGKPLPADLFSAYLQARHDDSAPAELADSGAGRRPRSTALLTDDAL